MNNAFSSIKKYVNRKQFKYGGYAVLITLFGIAVIVLVNIGLTVLEDNYDLRLDMSQNKAFTLNEETKKIVGGLTKDVYIYTLYSPGQEDNDALAILKKIKALSGHIHLENKDPGTNPGFVNQYQQSGNAIEDKSIIVSDKDAKLFRVLDLYAQYSAQYDENYQQTGVNIKVEGAVTSAINYIQLGYMPTLFLVQGHGEATIAELGSLSAVLSDQNYNLQTVNIGQTPEKLKPGDIIMFMDPKVDITDAERDTLTPLMLKGGRFFFMFEPGSADPAKLPNIMSLLKQYDIELKDGYIVEADPNFMIAAQNPMLLLPEIKSHAITDVIINNGVPALIQYSGAIRLPDVMPDRTMSATPLLTSSEQSYFKIKDPTKEFTPEQQEGDETGPFCVGAAVEKDNGSEDADDVRFVVFYNASFATVQNFANMDLFMNSADWMRNAEKDIRIRAKPISSPQIMIKSAAQFWVVVVVSTLLVPLLMLAAGIFVYLKRKHL